MVYAANVTQEELNRLKVSGYSTIMGVQAESGMLDAFGRWRVSAPYSIFESKQIVKDSALANNVENSPHLFDNQQTAGAGTATTFNVNTASTTLSVSATTAGTRVRQSKRWMNYQPGKSQRIFLTGVLGRGAAGITQRYGLFTAANGLFFEVRDGVAYVVRRTFVTGAVVDTAVEQADWNIDTLDGTGPSGVILDLDVTNIFYIDYEWLGVGSVRFGVVLDGVIYYVHQMNHANILATVYMSTPNLPVRAEITNDGTGPAYGLTMICAAIDSEGGVQPIGRDRSVGNGTTPLTLAAVGTEYALLGIRLRSSHLGVQVDPLDIGAWISSVSDVARYRLHINPTVTGTFAYADLANSSVQAAVASAPLPTITSAGYIITTGYFKSDIFATVPERLNEKIGSTIAGVADSLVLGITPITNNVDIVCALNWRELI